jgi:hypothetical protein
MNLNALAQSDYDRSIDKENEAVVFKGQITFGDLEKESSFSWLQSGADKYKPDSSTIKFLRKAMPAYNLVILLGTWCEDSHILIPKLYKTLKIINYPLAQVSIYGVDRAKQAKYVEHQLYRLERVPSIMVFKGFIEVGRIVETAERTVEEDLAGIIKSDLGRGNVD